MQFSFATLHSARSYWATLAVFAAANAWTWLRHRVGEPACCDRIETVGFPFPFHASGGIAGIDELLVTGLLLDLVLAWTVAVAAAWAALTWARRRDD